MVALTEYIADNRIRREAEALVQRGDTVHVICPPLERSRDQRVVGDVVIQPTRTLQLAGDNPLVYAIRYAVFFLAATAALLRLHRKYRYDIVQVHTMPDFLVFAAAVPKLLGAKVLLDVHDLTPELYATKFSLPESHWFIRLLRWLERRSVRFADAAIAVSDPHLSALVAHGNRAESFTVIMNSPDRRLIKAGSGSVRPVGSSFRLIYHGTVSRRHGLELAVRAVARARLEGVNVELRVIGDGDGLAELGHLVHELSLESFVTITQGSFPMEEIIPEIIASSCGIVPMINDEFTRHTLPVKLLEYVELGLPVICTRTSGIQEYFSEDMLFYFNSSDVDDLAARIVLLARNPRLAESYVEKAATAAKQIDWDVQRARYYQLIDSLVGGRG